MPGGPLTNTSQSCQLACCRTTSGTRPCGPQAPGSSDRAVTTSSRAHCDSSRARSGRSYRSARRRAPAKSRIRRAGPAGPGAQALDDRLDRREARAARDAQDVAGRAVVHDHGAPGRAEQDRVARAGVLDQGGADLPAWNGADMQVQGAVSPGCVGDGVAAPDPRPPQDLHAQVLAGLVREWLAGPDREHGQIGAAPFVADHLRDPPRRLVGRVLRRGRHHRADVAQRRVPGGRGLLVPGRPVEHAQRRGQRLAEDLVVPFLDAVLPVVAPQLAQVLVQRLRVVHAPGAPGQRRAERPALLVHGQREHGAQFGMGREKNAVEIGHLPIGGGAGLGQGLFQDCVIRPGRALAEFGTFFSGAGRGGRGLRPGDGGLARRGPCGARDVRTSGLSRKDAWRRRGERAGFCRRRGERVRAGRARGGVLRRFLPRNSPARCNRHALNCGSRACYRQVIPGKPGSALGPPLNSRY